MNIKDCVKAPFIHRINVRYNNPIIGAIMMIKIEGVIEHENLIIIESVMPTIDLYRHCDNSVYVGYTTIVCGPLKWAKIKRLISDNLECVSKDVYCV